MNLRSFASLAALAVAAVGAARWAMVDRDVPVDAILPNLEQAARAHPKDANAHYVLGRVHSLAFASGAKTVRVLPEKERSQREGKPLFAGYASIRVTLNENAPMTPQRRRHLQRSLEEYGKATRLDVKNPLYFLGLGWMREMAIKADPRAAAFHRQEALKAYRSVIRLRAEEEKAMTAYGLSPDARLAHEAALGLTRLLADTTWKPAIAERERMVALAKELAAKPMPITPILVPLTGETHLPGLLDSNRTSRFDLAGDGLKRDWPWVRPTTGILVWDPLDTGKITSGRQLFGSATWWMFFRDGYAALASLDADRDGWLKGSELSGIRVWQDLDGDGVSDPGEVRPLGHWRITGLNTQASHRDAAGPRAERGLIRSDGSVAPTFDWVPTSK
ncbi:MAG: hypothetical protein ACO1SV_11380 [Fimbriimonas sp.]